MSTYTELSVTDGQATVEFSNQAGDIKQTRTINIFGLTNEEKLERYASHLRTFDYRIQLGMLTPTQEPTE